MAPYRTEEREARAAHLARAVLIHFRVLDVARSAKLFDGVLELLEEG